MPKDTRTAEPSKKEGELQLTLLDELDARQNDVLAQLDELNHRIEVLLQEFTHQRPVDELSVTDKAA